ncbi:FR47-like protein domain-containing protein [Phthorimaea operculella]|nr:FR47-like protein domain-containing protein [Phthorimaea operculella]
MEPLIEIPREKWADLRDLYLTNWPEGAEAYILLNIQIANPTLSQEFDFHVYCPDGELANGMVATFEKADYYQVIIQPIGDNIAKIEEALLTTSIVNWNRFLMVPYANATAVDCLERIKHKLGLNLMYNGESKAYKHFLDKGSKLYDFELPPNTYIGPLRPEHIDIVDKTWTYKSKNSHTYFESLMKCSLSYVLYSRSEKGNSGKRKEDDNLDEETKEKNSGGANAGQELNEKQSDVKHLDEPAAWLSVGESGTLSHLYCSEKHRRKGYSEILTKYVVNELLSKGHDAIAYTLEDNTNPKKLFSKLGFKDLGYNQYVMVNKIAW